MRVPLSKKYRAFRELDEFTDEECRQWCRSAGVGCNDSPLLAGVVAVCLHVVFVVVLAMLLGGPIVEVVARTSLADSLADRLEAHPYQIGGAFFIICYLVLIITILWVRDSVVQTTLAMQITRTTCPACRRSLLGSARSADAVRCRHCNVVHAYTALRVQSEDLGPALFHLKTGARCPECSYLVEALPAQHGVLTCPECGRTIHVVQNGTPGHSVPSGAST